MNDIILVLFTVVIILVWWLFFVAKQNYCLDLTRQKLFNIRDKLFDAAANREIPFDEPAYGMTRTTLNGMIRFTHQVNIPFLAVIFLTHKYVYKGRRSTDYRQQFDAAMKHLPIKQKQLLLKALADAHLTIINYVMSTSPILWPILKPISILLSLLHKTNQFRKWALRGKKRKEPWSVLDAEAHFIGNQNYGYSFPKAA